MPTYFLLDPFEFPYYFYRLQGELIYVLSIDVFIPSTFCPTLGHNEQKVLGIHTTMDNTQINPPPEYDKINMGNRTDPEENM